MNLSNVNAGDALYAMFFYRSAGPVLSFSDSKGNSWTTIKTGTLATSQETIAVGCAIAGSSGSDAISFLVNGTATQVDGSWYEVRDSTCTLDVAAAFTDTNAQTTCNSGPMTTHTPNDLLVGTCGLQNLQSNIYRCDPWTDAFLWPTTASGTDGGSALQFTTTPGTYTLCSVPFGVPTEQGTIGAAFLATTLAMPTLTLSSSPNPSTYSQVVTLTATVSNGVTGTITFYDGGYDGGNVIGSASISGTTATLPTTSLELVHTP